MAAARATSAAYVVVSPRSAMAARSPTRVAVSHSIRAKLGLKSAEVRKGAQGPNQTGGRAATLVPRAGGAMSGVGAVSRRGAGATCSDGAQHRTASPRYEPRL